LPSKRPRKPKTASSAKPASRASKPASSARGRAKTGTTKKPATRKPTTAKRAGTAPTPKAPQPSRTAGPGRAELLTHAKAAGIRGYSRMTLAQLRDALARRVERPSPASAPSQPETRPIEAPSSVAGLPWRYGVNELVAMPIDPLLVHVYWELSPAAVTRVWEELGSSWEGSQFVLRA
jgi:hypothetical protein